MTILCPRGLKKTVYENLISENTQSCRPFDVDLESHPYFIDILITHADVDENWRNKVDLMKNPERRQKNCKKGRKKISWGSKEPPGGEFFSRSPPNHSYLRNGRSYFKIDSAICFLLDSIDQKDKWTLKNIEKHYFLFFQISPKWIKTQMLPKVIVKKYGLS